MNQPVTLTIGGDLVKRDLLPDLLEEDVSLTFEILCKLELIELDETDYLGPGLVQFFKIGRILQACIICLKNEDANVCDRVKIFFIEIWKFFLAKDRFIDV